MVKQIEDKPTQLSLPDIGPEPTLIRLAPLPFTQLVLYRPDLLIDSIIKVPRLQVFEITAPDYDAAKRILKYQKGDNNA